MEMRLPLRIVRYNESFGIHDAHDTVILYVYFDKGSPGELAIRKRLSEPEAEEIVKRVARFLTDDESAKATGET